MWWLMGCGVLGLGGNGGEEATAPVPVPAPAPTDPEPRDTGISDPQAPRILSLSTSASRLSEGEWFSITAIVTDPDGIDDVIGGELMASDGSSYGAFATQAQEGAYEIEVSWDDIDAAEGIEFDTSAAIDMLARFYDQAGNTAQQLVSIELTCEGTVACDGRCVAADDARNCGGCGVTCQPEPGLFEATCVDGACVVLSDCDNDVGMTCAQRCAQDGYRGCAEVLVEGWWDLGAGIVSNLPGACNQEVVVLPDCQTRMDSVLEREYGASCFCLD